MREILFKGKRIDNDEWVAGLPSYDMNGNLGEMEVYRGFCYCDTFEVDPETVCQYTGLTDKNGRKIFEGDIIEDIDYGYMRCMYKGGTFIWYNEKGFGIKFMTYIPTIEVIGNIFDNPELLHEMEDRLDG